MRFIREKASKAASPRQTSKMHSDGLQTNDLGFIFTRFLHHFYVEYHYQYSLNITIQGYPPGVQNYTLHPGLTDWSCEMTKTRPLPINTRYQGPQDPLLPITRKSPFQECEVKKV